jgi:hypothetical protein
VTRQGNNDTSVEKITSGTYPRNLFFLSVLGLLVLWITSSQVPASSPWGFPLLARVITPSAGRKSGLTLASETRTQSICCLVEPNQWDHQPSIVLAKVLLGAISSNPVGDVDGEETPCAKTRVKINKAGGAEKRQYKMGRVRGTRTTESKAKMRWQW